MRLLCDDVISLRALEPGDIDILYRWENDTELWEVGLTIAPFSRQQLADYIENYDGNIFTARQLRLMVTLKSSGETVGTVDLYDYDPVNCRSAIGILIDSAFARRGYGAAALRLMERYCFSRLGLHQLYCVVPEDNIASRALFSSAGYNISGRLRSWLRRNDSYRDAYIYQRMLQPDS